MAISKYTTGLALVLFIVTVFTSNVVSATTTGEPWNFLFSMGVDKNNVALKSPQSLYIDSEAKRYYINDSGNNRLLSFSKSGEPLHSFNAEGTLEKPISMIKRGKSILYVAEKAKGSITRVNLKTRDVSPLNLTHNGRDLIAKKIKDTAAKTIILDSLTGSLIEVSEKFDKTQQIICEKCSSPIVDFKINDNYIYTLTQRDGSIYSFSLSGKYGAEIVLDPPPEFPVSFALDGSKNIYVLERHLGKVSVYSSNGKLKYQFLEKGEKEGQLYYPIDMQFDPWGRLCIVEEGNGRVSVYGH